MNLEQPSVPLIILFIWLIPHFGKGTFWHDVIFEDFTSGTQVYFLQHSPVDDVSMALYPISQMAFCDGHWVSWHFIFESLWHVQDVQTLGYHTSPCKWPLSSQARHSASLMHFPLWRTVPTGQKQPSCKALLQIDRSFAMVSGLLTAVDDLICFSFSSLVLHVSVHPHGL